MKYVKTLGLAAIAATALVALVGASSASATVFCKKPPTGVPTGTTCPAGAAYGAETVIHAVNTKPVVLSTSFKNIECTKSTLEGKTKQEGGAAETITLTATSFTLEGCNCAVNVIKPGTQEAHWISGTDNATITSSGQEITSQCSTIFGNVHCIYTTSNTDLGEARGSATETSSATLHIESANIPRLTTNELCAEEASWTATYETDSPKPLWFAAHT